MNKEYLIFLFKKLDEAEKRLKEYNESDKVFPSDSAEIFGQFDSEISISLNRELTNANASVEMYLFHHK